MDKITIDFKEYEQLLAARNALNAVMRENERLRTLLKWGMKAHNDKKFDDNWYADAEDFFHYKD